MAIDECYELRVVSKAGSVVLLESVGELVYSYWCIIVSFDLV